jgi:hypothetical protein
VSVHEVLPTLDALVRPAPGDGDVVASTNLRLDAASMPDEVWVAPFLPAQTYSGYDDSEAEYPTIIPDMSVGRWVGKAALRPFFADEATPAARVAEVVRMPDKLNRLLGEYLLKGAFGADGIGNGDTSEMRKIIADMGGELHRITRSQSGERTTTVIPLASGAPGAGKKSGSHIDGRWRGVYDKALGQWRLTAPRRLIGNGGPGMRMTFFCPIDALTIAALAGVSEDTPHAFLAFKEYHRKYPGSMYCVGIPVRPGYALVVPTELCLHDGSTFFASEPSVSIQAHGEWGRGVTPIV